MEDGQLPSARDGLQATLVDQTLYVSGGYKTPATGDYHTSILSWDPVAESWQPAGNLVDFHSLYFLMKFLQSVFVDGFFTVCIS